MSQITNSQYKLKMSNKFIDTEIKKTTNTTFLMILSL